MTQENSLPALWDSVLAVPLPIFNLTIMRDKSVTVTILVKFHNAYDLISYIKSNHCKTFFRKWSAHSKLIYATIMLFTPPHPRFKWNYFW